MFKLEFCTDNAAFENGAESEIVRIMSEVRLAITAGVCGAAVRDVNGNVVGSWSYERPALSDEERYDYGIDEDRG